MHLSPPNPDPSTGTNSGEAAKEPVEEEEEEEEVSEWKEGRDVVVERQPCVPGEDVQVQVLRGAATAAADSDASNPGSGHHGHDAKHLKETVKKWEGEEEGKVREKCKGVGKVLVGRGG